ncbi:MAG: cytochrome b [Oceanococcus sp.]|nr:MAG: cytochrome b [Oceanococcus sp.]
MNADSSTRYGTLTRILHWSMAVLFAIQFTSAMAHYGFEDSAFEALFWPWHKPLGFVLLVLAALRLAWALAQRTQRPPSVSLAARLGHIALYLLMISIPALALIRQYGSGRSFEPFGLPLMGGFDGAKIDWMVDLGSLLHGELGWLLFVLVCGHALMVLIHRMQGAQHDVWPRMWGKPD